MGVHVFLISGLQGNAVLVNGSYTDSNLNQSLMSRILINILTNAYTHIDYTYVYVHTYSACTWCVWTCMPPYKEVRGQCEAAQERLWAPNLTVFIFQVLGLQVSPQPIPGLRGSGDWTLSIKHAKGSSALWSRPTAWGAASLQTVVFHRDSNYLITSSWSLLPVALSLSPELILSVSTVI